MAVEMNPTSGMSSGALYFFFLGASLAGIQVSKPFWAATAIAPARESTPIFW